MVIIGNSEEKDSNHFIIGKELESEEFLNLDISFPHVILISGKRGTGKSYSLGVIAEGLLETSQLVLLVDTMNIYWTMFKKNTQKESKMLSKYELFSEGLPINLITIRSNDEFYETIQSETELVRITKLTLLSSELSASEWCDLFDLNINSPMGMALFDAVSLVSERRNFSLADIIAKLNEIEIPIGTLKALERRLKSVEQWGLFGEKGIKLNELMDNKYVNILDLGIIPRGFGGGMRNVLLTILIRKIMNNRIRIRKYEELAELSDNAYLYKSKIRKGLPPLWLLIDEAHQFVPRKGTTVSKPALITWAKEGRQPGLGLVMATQRPGALDPEILSQCDIIFSHRITLNQDLRALNDLSQNYMTQTLRYAISEIKGRGKAIIMDDITEKLIKAEIRPRKTWHGGGERKIKKY